MSDKREVIDLILYLLEQQYRGIILMNNLKRIESLKRQIATKEEEYRKLSFEASQVSNSIATFQINLGISSDSKSIKDLNMKHSKLARNLEKRRDTINKLYEELRSLT